MLSCKETSKIISLGELQDLTFSKKLFLRVHFFICKPCKVYQKQLKLITEFMKQHHQSHSFPCELKQDLLKLTQQ